MAKLSGAARKRRKKVNALLAARDSVLFRLTDGGDIIDRGVAALGAVASLSGPNRDLHLIRGDDMAILLDLIAEEIRTGREVQSGPDETGGPA